MALFGSDVEKKCKAAAADGEPQWDNAGVKPGLQIWRIEQFKVKPWPEKKYGQFHTGDSYIVLNTYVKDPVVNPDKLAWDVHFWIGSSSTQDEYGTAAYKTVELDDKLGGAAVQHREVESSESDLFCSYFAKGLRYLKGGTATGFKHVETKGEARDPVLLHVKGAPGKISLRQVHLRRSKLNSGDVFVLDTTDALYQWNGKESSAHEKAKAAEVCKLLQQDYAAVKYREIIVLDEGTPEGDGVTKEFRYRSEHGFWRHLPGQRRLLGITISTIQVQDASKGGSDEAVKAFAHSLFHMSDGGGESAKFVCVWKGSKPPVSTLRTERVMLFDDGYQVFLWAGKKAPRQDRSSAFVFAQSYLKRYKRPPVLPITRFNEGMESEAFKAYFGPPEAAGCCIIS